jgi:lysophospholipase L1-like esterase
MGDSGMRNFLGRPRFLSSLLLAFLGTVAGLPLGFGQQQDTTVAQWEAEIKSFENADKTNPPPHGAILFIGSSSIRLWKTLARDFPEHQVINRGFGGSQIIDSVTFAERILLPYQPRMVVLYAGGNDINSGKSPEQVLADYQSFVKKIHAALPETRIAYISIAPNPARWAQVERVKAANKLIGEYARQHAKLAFINVFPHMLGEDGQPRPELFVEDRLHMNATGYALWTKILRPYLKEAK